VSVLVCRPYCSRVPGVTFPHVFVNIIQKEGRSPSKHRQRICGVRASLEPHRTYVDGVKKGVLADLRRKKKREGGSPHFRMAVVGAGVFFILSFGVGWITQHFTYMRIRAPATATVASPCMYVCTVCRCARRRPSGSKNESEGQRKAYSRAWNRFITYSTLCTYTTTTNFWTREKPCVAWLTRGDRCPLERGGFRGYKCEIYRNLSSSSWCERERRVSLCF